MFESGIHNRAIGTSELTLVEMQRVVVSRKAESGIEQVRSGKALTILALMYKNVGNENKKIKE